MKVLLLLARIKKQSIEAVYNKLKIKPKKPRVAELPAEPQTAEKMLKLKIQKNLPTMRKLIVTRKLHAKKA